MKHTLRRLAALLVAVLLPSFALAVNCQSCTRSVDAQKMAYCPYCGAKVESGLTIERMSQQQDGSVLVEWSDERQNGPYKVNFRYFVDEDFFSQRQQAQINWSADTDIASKSYELETLVPGKDYWVVVTDASGGQTQARYVSPAARTFDAFETGCAYQLLLQEGDDKNPTECFTQADTEVEKRCGMKLRVTFEALGVERDYDIMVAITDPTGIPIRAAIQDDVVLEADWVNWGWDMFRLDWYFARVRQMYGTVPEGNYRVAMYLDGLKACECTFQVK